MMVKVLLAVHTPILIVSAFTPSASSVRRYDRSLRHRHGIPSNDVRIFATDERRGATSTSNSRPSPSEAELGILQLAQSHFAAQALVAIMRMGALDVLELSPRSITVDDIIAKVHRRHANHDAASAENVNRDALFRCLRLLCTTGVIEETTKDIDGVGESAFSLTEMGQLLQQPESSSKPSMASFILHWAEPPIWNSWAELPDYVGGGPSDVKNGPPFDKANGVSASEYFMSNPDSCSHRNAVARYASSREIPSILDAMQHSSALNESMLDGKMIVDVGGGYGDLMRELKISMPSVGKCYCLDLPDVIDDAMSSLSESKEQDEMVGTELIPGDMFDVSTIPKCDLIVTKHVLCDFSDEDVVSAMQSFNKALSKDGIVVIMDAVLPNGNELNGKWNPAVSFDVLLMLTGRRGERSRLEWSNLAGQAGLVLEDVLPTSSVTVDLAVLSKK